MGPFYFRRSMTKTFSLLIEQLTEANSPSAELFAKVWNAMGRDLQLALKDLNPSGNPFTHIGTKMRELIAAGNASPKVLQQLNQWAATVKARGWDKEATRIMHGKLNESFIDSILDLASMKESSEAYTKAEVDAANKKGYEDGLGHKPRDPKYNLTQAARAMVSYAYSTGYIKGFQDAETRRQAGKGLKESAVKPAMPIPGHTYHTKTDDQLRYIMKDAHAAAQAMKDHSPAAEAKYLDQVNDASSVLGYRMRLAAFQRAGFNKKLDRLANK